MLDQLAQCKIMATEDAVVAVVAQRDHQLAAEDLAQEIQDKLGVEEMVEMELMA